MSIDTTEFNNDALLRSIRRKAYIPKNDEVFSDTDILEMATEEIRTYCVPLLKEINEEFLIRRQLYTVGSQSDPKLYRLPPRCSAEVIKAVQYQGTDGSFFPLERVEPESAHYFGENRFYLEDDHVILTQTPSFSVLRVLYFMRPNKLVLPSTCRQVIDCAESLGVWSVSFYYDATAGFAGTPQYTGIDVIQNQPGFRSVVMDRPYAIDPGGVTAGFALNADDTQRPEPDDWVAAAGQSPFPQVPAEVHPLLAQRVAMRMLEGKNAAGYQLLANELVATEQRIRGLLRNRVEGSSRYIHNFQGAAWKNVRSSRRLR